MNVRHNCRLWLEWLICIALIAGTPAAQQQLGNSVKSESVSRSPAAGEVSMQERYPRYRLHKSDVVELAFAFSPEFNQTVTVQPDGFITLKEVGDLQVEGLTVSQMVEKVRSAYTKILADPVVTALLNHFEKPYVIVTGQVTRPGKYELHGDTTATEAIAIAGGFNDAAKHSQVVLYRRLSAELSQAKLLDMKKMLKERDLGEDIQLKSGDILFVPKNTLSKIRQFIPTPGVGIPIN